MKKKLMIMGLFAVMMFSANSIAKADGCRTVSVECYEGAGFGFTGYVCGNYFEQALQEAILYRIWCIEEQQN